MKNNKYSPYTKILANFSRILKDNHIKWCVGSTTSLFFQGVKVFPKDIDIVINKKQMKMFINELEKDGFILLIDTDLFNGKRFVKASINQFSMPIEFVGFDITKDKLLQISINNIDIYVHSLEDELKFYKSRVGKEQIVNLIIQKLKSK